MEKKKRGRPPLPEEEREARRRESYKRHNEKRRLSGWESEKKYAAEHPEVRSKKYANWVTKYYSPKINIPREVKPTFDFLLASTGKTISELVLGALEKQYGVNLHAGITDQTHDIPTHQDDE